MTTEDRAARLKSMDDDEFAYSGELCLCIAQIENAKAHLRGKERLTGCTSFVQRRLGIGYNQAARIMIELEAQKFITPPDMVGERKLLP